MHLRDLVNWKAVFRLPLLGRLAGGDETSPAKSSWGNSLGAIDPKAPARATATTSSKDKGDTGVDNRSSGPRLQLSADQDAVNIISKSAVGDRERTLTSHCQGDSSLRTVDRFEDNNNVHQQSTDTLNISLPQRNIIIKSRRAEHHNLCATNNERTVNDLTFSTASTATVATATTTVTATTATTTTTATATAATVTTGPPSGKPAAPTPRVTSIAPVTPASQEARPTSPSQAPVTEIAAPPQLATTEKVHTLLPSALPSPQPGVASAPSRSQESATSSLATSNPHVSRKDADKIMQRKIWVRRPGASATLVTVQEDDLVDTVRDVILEKYRNSLGRSVDSPDISLRLVLREQSSKNVPLERNLGPDEHIGRLLDSQYPSGQTIDDALVIDIPQRRTPRPSPRTGNHHYVVPHNYFVDDHRPNETAREYFPPMALHSPNIPSHAPPALGTHLPPHNMTILTTNQPPAIQSPGGYSASARRHGNRPKYMRQHTSSPTILHSQQPHGDDINSQMTNGISTAAPLATPPPAQDHRQTLAQPNRPNSPHLGQRPKKAKKNSSQQQQQQQQTATTQNNTEPTKLASAGLLDGKVPPINVLIVEDNNINMRLLEQFMRKLKVRFSTAVNGREAVDQWKRGGFHLVLMDIQLPVMSGLEATKEIRRLESVNGIGLGLVGGQTNRGQPNGNVELRAEDKLDDISLFKSPVIIVALTASSLQSDRHEALAVGCNDFLTKPVGFPWMVRKVTEWGCMQALIDFDGWRQWKASAEKQDEGLTEEQKKANEKEQKDKRKAALKAMFTAPPPTTRTVKEEKPEPERRSPQQTNGAGPRRIAARGSSGSGSGIQLETHAEENEE